MNQEALQVLHNFPGNPPIDYYKAGDTATCRRASSTAGLSAQILGPPTDAALIKQDQQQERGIPRAATIRSMAVRSNRSPRAYSVPTATLCQHGLRLHTAQAEIEMRVSSVQPDTLAAKAAMANNSINNQSLVVLFTYKGKTLLFAGDAQWGNWANFLFGGRQRRRPGITAEAKAILGKLDFYKVGHHGSTNATPKDALVGDARRLRGDVLDRAQGLQRSAARAADGRLEKKTKNQFVRSDQVGAGNEQKVDPKIGPVPDVFKTTSTATFGYIDYEF